LRHEPSHQHAGLPVLEKVYRSQRATLARRLAHQEVARSDLKNSIALYARRVELRTVLLAAKTYEDWLPFYYQSGKVWNAE